MSIEELYQELLLDHAKAPRNTGKLTPADADFSINNPLCGDRVHLYVRKEHEGLSLRFEGVGCSISQASASLMTELCNGRSLKEVARISALFRKMMQNDLNEQEILDLQDAAALAGVRKFSSRIRCALLAWEALDRCVERVK